MPEAVSGCAVVAVNRCCSSSLQTTRMAMRGELRDVCITPVQLADGPTFRRLS